MSLGLYLMEDEFALIMTDPFGRVFVIGVGEMCEPELADGCLNKGSESVCGGSPNLEDADSCPSIRDEMKRDIAKAHRRADYELFKSLPNPRIDPSVWRW